MKKHIFRRTAAGILAALMLAGCAAGQEVGTGSKGFSPALDTEAALQLEVLGFFGNFEALDQVTNDFNQYYPNITFAYQQVGGSSLEEYLDLNPEVDIFMVSSEFMNCRGATLPDRCQDLSDLDMSAIDEQMLRLYNIGGVQKAIPMSQNITGMVVNTTLLEKEGLSIPDNTQAFLSALAALKEKGYTPIQGSAGKVYAELTLSWLSHSLCTDENLLESAGNGDPAALEKLASAFEFLDTIVKNGYTDPEVNEALPADNYDGSILSFFEGNTPFWICNSEKVSGMKKRETKSEAFQAAPFQYTFVYVPFGEENGCIYQEPWFGFALGQGSTHSDYAKEFLRFLATKDEINTMADIKGVPSVAKEHTSPAVYADIQKPEILENRVVNTGAVTPEITAAWYTCTTAYAGGEYASPEQAVQTFLDMVC